MEFYDKIGGQTELELNKKFTSSLSKVISGLSFTDKKTQKDVQLKFDALLLKTIQQTSKQLNEVRGNLDKLKNERTQLENNLSF